MKQRNFFNALIDRSNQINGINLNFKNSAKGNDDLI